mmetsp:Transcript_65094/g.190952  ORF Transcript_65094/g.190952 Transcript_65094/m.190952 type:complete len:598 (-) Transcript_65094:13-1806(-)
MDPSEETPWQNRLVQLSIGVSAASFFVLGGVWAIGGSGTDTVGLVIILPAVAALLLLFAGVLAERQAVSERLPNISHRRLAQFLGFCVFVVPLLHLGFLLIVLTAALLALFAAIDDEWDGQEWIRARLVAVFDGFMCLAFAGVMLSAGPGGDYYMARMCIAVYSVLAVLLPLMVFFQDIVDEAWFGKLTCFGYFVPALHTALIVLKAVSSLVTEAIKGPRQLFTEDNCIRSLLPSPTAASFTFMGSFAQSDVYEEANPANWSLYCPKEDLTPLAMPPPVSCDSIGADWLFYWLLVGAFCVLLMWVWMRWRSNRRVNPEDEVRGSTSGDSLGFVAKICATFVPIAGFSMVLMVVGAAVLRCPPVDVPTMATSIAAAMPLGNVPSTTTTTTSTFTTSITTTMTFSTSSTSSTLTTTHYNDTLINITRNATYTTTTGTATVTSTTFTMSRTSTLTNETLACPPLPVKELPDITSWTTPAATGCQCGLNGLHGLWAPVAVPFEQLSQTWCELGSWAPLLVGSFFYACHVLPLTLVNSENQSRVVREKRAKQEREMDLIRQPPDQRPEKKKVLELFEVSEREERPEPVAGGRRTGKPRVFMV